MKSRPTGARWNDSYDEAGIKAFLAHMDEDILLTRIIAVAKSMPDMIARDTIRTLIRK